VTDIIQWPSTILDVKPRVTNGLGLCFSVKFWRQTQQDLKLDSSAGDMKNNLENNILTVRMNMVTESTTLSGISAQAFPLLL
jgi:hypothetical protein